MSSGTEDAITEKLLGDKVREIQKFYPRSTPVMPLKRCY